MRLALTTVLIAALVAPALAQTRRTDSTARPTRPTTTPPTAPAGSGGARSGTPARTQTTPATRTPTTPAQPKNALLPAQVAIEGLFPELMLTQKLPAIAPSGFEPLYTAEDWKTYRERFGAEADDMTRRRSSGHFEFAKKLLEAADDTKASPGLRRLLLVRVVGITYRSGGGFEPANKAVTKFQELMNLQSPADMAALWTMTNSMSKYATTPRPERIRYSGIAARANIQLTMLLLERDQLEAAANLVKGLAYHEGYLRAEPALRGRISQTRALVGQTITMMEYLGRQYDPALRGDEGALMSLYVYGKFVKRDESFAHQVASRGQNGAVGQVHQAIEKSKTDAVSHYAAAELLRAVAANVPEGVLRNRTLYAALGHYRAFLADERTRDERVKRTLTRMQIEAVVADGARGPQPIVAFEPAARGAGGAETQPASQPATQPRALAGETVPAIEPVLQ